MVRTKPVPKKRDVENAPKAALRESTVRMPGRFTRIVDAIRERSRGSVAAPVPRWQPDDEVIAEAFKRGCVSGVDADHCIYRALASEAYRERGRERIGDLDLVRSSPTLKLYRKRGTDDYIAGVRGTYDKQDIIADAALAAGALRRTSRYQADRALLADVLASSPSARIRTASHSLGGAIARELAAEFGDRLRGGVTFNSAFGADQLVGPDRGLVNYYTSTDPLGRLAKPFVPNLRIVSADHLSPLEAHKLSTFAE